MPLRAHIPLPCEKSLCPLCNAADFQIGLYTHTAHAWTTALQCACAFMSRFQNVVEIRVRLLRNKVPSLNDQFVGFPLPPKSKVDQRSREPWRRAWKVLFIARMLHDCGGSISTLDLGGKGDVEKFGSWDGTLFRKNRYCKNWLKI